MKTIENLSLSQEIVDAIKKDDLIKRLYLDLNSIYSKSIPTIVIKEENSFKIIYKEEVIELINKIQEHIYERQLEIIEHFNKIYSINFSFK